MESANVLWHPLSRAAMLLLTCSAAAPTGAQTANASGSQVPVGDQYSACTNPSIEATLRQRETALLGPRHADEHAQARAKICRIAARQEQPAATISATRAQSPSTVGEWSGPINIPVIGVTSVLLHTGEVLFWSYDPKYWGDPNNSNTGKAYVWDPVSKQGKEVTPPENIWCGGQTILSDGRVYIAGGNLRYPDGSAPAGTTGWEGAMSSYTFNPVAKSWTRQPDMVKGRWYPSVTKLMDNRVIVTSGLDQMGGEALVQEVELFTPSDAINGVGKITNIGLHNPTGLYPFQYLLPSGQMLQAGPDQWNSALLTPNTWGWSNLGIMGTSHYGYGNGIIYTDASVTPFKQTVVIAGGVNSSTTIAANEWLDGYNPSSGWKAFPSWLEPRHNSNTVILPDGTLFTVGGNSGTTTYDGPLYETELYNKPATDLTGNWLKMQPNSLPAAYHSTALLLPDATVLLSKDDLNHTAEGHQIDIYSPPYLFKGARPTITSWPSTTLSLGQTFSIGADDNRISSAVLVAPGAVTHGNDMHQRVIKLQVRLGARNLEATVPASGTIVPPGYYMLFIINNKGIPSVAKFVKVGQSS